MDKKVIKIEGMMCPHCSASVKEALEAIDGVADAEVSHESGKATVTFSTDVSDSSLKKAIEERDYKVVSID